MSKVYVPSDGVESWRRLLAEPEKQWARGYSARTIANDWEHANDMPPAIAVALQNAFGLMPEPLIILPEHKVAMPGRGKDSQNDVFVLLGVGDHTAAMTIEGKVNEPFGPTLEEWEAGASGNKRKRLEGVLAILGLARKPDPSLRYQLFHRTASCVVEAARFRCKYAIMLVQSYSQQRRWHGDYEKFAAQFSLDVKPGVIDKTLLGNGIELYLGWVDGDPSMLEK